MGDNKDTQSSAGSAIAALAKRFWSIHPKEIQDLGITREQFYEREMRALFATLVPGGPQTPLTRDEIAGIIRDKVDYFIHDEQGPFAAADAILAALVLPRPEGK